MQEKEKFYFKDGNVLWLKEFSGIDPDFLKFALRSFVEGLQRLSHGSTYSALPIEKLKKHKIFVPDKDSQQKIVQNLKSLSTQTQALEALYQRKLDALEELKQSLLQKAFAGELTQAKEVAA